MPEVQMWTDGSTVPANPGPGAFVAVLFFPDRTRVIGLPAGQSTNNRMETMAVLLGLKALEKKHYSVTIYTDSQYVIYGMKKILTGKMPKTNVDIWEQFIEWVKPYDIDLVKVEGHSGHPLNDLADETAYECARDQTKHDKTVGWTVK